MDAVKSTDVEAKRRIAAVAAGMLDGTIDLLDGCRQITNHRAGLSPLSLSDGDVQVLVVIESELDDVPSGAARAYWAADALADKERKKDDYLAEVKEQLTRACRAIVEKWGPDKLVDFPAVRV
jgi:hypothetical protein